MPQEGHDTYTPSDAICRLLRPGYKPAKPTGPQIVSEAHGEDARRLNDGSRCQLGLPGDLAVWPSGDALTGA